MPKFAFTPFPRRFVLGFGLLVCAASRLILNIPQSGAASTGRTVSALSSLAEPGAAVRTGPPWGQLTVTPMLTGWPDPNRRQAACSTQVLPWFFPDHDAASLDQLFARLKLGAALRSRLRARTTCVEGPPAQCIVRPNVDMIGELGSARVGLYEILAGDPDNYQANSPHWRADRIEALFSMLRPRVRADVLSLFRALLYRRGDFYYFSDPPLLCSQVSPSVEMTRLGDALIYESMVRAELRIPEGAPVDELVRYWGAGGRGVEVRPLLESLARRPGGGSIDVGELLPRMPHLRLYSYEPADRVEKSCYWSALYFFSPYPPEVVIESPEVVKRLLSDYVRIEPKQARLGDVVAFVHPRGYVLHLAAYIADDILFTKNGLSSKRPFGLARLPAIREMYKDEEGIQELYYRRIAG